MNNLRCLTGSVAVVVLLADCAFAADIPPAPPPAQPIAVAPARTYDLILELGAGAQVRPAYEGAKDYQIDPTGFATLHYLWLPGLGELKSGRKAEGFFIGPSFRYVSKRDSNDSPQLLGLNNIDAAFELGAKVGYDFSWVRPWVAVRYGLGGHSGIVGETGLNFVFRPTELTEFTVGPRASFANSEYMQTYLGVSPVEAARSPFMWAYAPGGGFKGVGIDATARYQFTPQWAVVGELIYERLVGDAANSPIVQVGGDVNQFTGKLGLSYKFGMKLFKD
jgi:outer membrane protein